MGEPGSKQRHEPGDRDDGETIQFGGLPFPWPFPDVRLPRLPHLPPAKRVGVTVGMAMLAAGLLIGFIGGRVTAHQAGQKARSLPPVSLPIITAPFATITISPTGARCAVQVGKNLQLGVEIANHSGRTILLRRITPVFPLGGLRAISSGVGTCGALPASQLTSSGFLTPGASEWIHTTLAVRVSCPEPLPVWFKVKYTFAGTSGTATLPVFPDLGPVSYRHCKTSDQNDSSIIAIVENGTNHSSRG